MNVERIVGNSIIWLDAIAVTIWILALLLTRKWRPLLFCVIGFIVYYLVDAVLWMRIMGIRKIYSVYNEWLVQIWLQMGPGIIHPSFVCLMLEGTFGPQRKRVKKEFWVLLFIIVQFCPPFLSSSFKNTSTIHVCRTMSMQRGYFVLIGAIGYMILSLCNVSIPSLWSLFLIGLTVEGFFELSLLVSGIRQSSLLDIIENAIIEFNVGMGYIVFLWRWMYKGEDRKLMDFGASAFERKDNFVLYTSLL